MLSMYLSILDSPEEKIDFEKLYNTHKRTMLYTAFNILKDHYLAEDAVHEAFIRIAKNFSKVEDVNSSRTRYFTIVIVRNVALAYEESCIEIKVGTPHTNLYGETRALLNDNLNQGEFLAVALPILSAGSLINFD